MPVSEDYLAFLTDQLIDWRDVSVRRMFGGAGLYVGGTMFGLVADDTLFLRVDDDSRPDYEREGCAPFRPFHDRKPMPYYEIPAHVLEDPTLLHAWADRALQAARNRASP
ncbi:MAG: TfoX/Sxy family protein [Candidatus Bipolaricaulota bacterium]|nr:MAG: TfoX/Sxy family protein [Candidatus Bipolaricaulota bacterium]